MYFDHNLLIFLKHKADSFDLDSKLSSVKFINLLYVLNTIKN